MSVRFGQIGGVLELELTLDTEIFRIVFRQNAIFVILNAKINIIRLLDGLKKMLM